MQSVSGYLAAWDVFANGEEFLRLRPIAESRRKVSALTMLLNWQQLPALQKGGAQRGERAWRATSGMERSAVSGVISCKPPFCFRPEPS